MNSKICLLSAILLAWSLGPAANLHTNNKISRFTGERLGGEICTYKIKDRVYNEQEMKSFMAKFKLNLSQTNIEADDGLRKFTSGNKSAMFNEKRSEFLYNDNSVESINSTDTEEPSELRLRAGKILRSIMGGEAEDFELAAISDIQLNDGRTDEPQVLYHNFEYMKKLDGRMITGDKIGVLIRVGKENEIQHVSIKNPNIEAKEPLAQKIPTDASSLRDRFQKRMENRKLLAFGQEDSVIVRDVDVRHVFESYVPSEVGEKIVLKPNVTMICESILDNGESLIEEINFSEDENDLSSEERPEGLSDEVKERLNR